MAGLGHLPGGEDPNQYFHHNLHCDVLIVGAGPAGLAAALSAMQSGARVLLAEQDLEVGGSLPLRRVIDKLDSSMAQPDGSFRG
jgi:sarcosine oxidase subunit alpha